MDYTEFYGSFRESFLHHAADYDSWLNNGIAGLHEGTKKMLKKSLKKMLFEQFAPRENDVYAVKFEYDDGSNSCVDMCIYITSLHELTYDSYWAWIDKDDYMKDNTSIIIEYETNCSWVNFAKGLLPYYREEVISDDYKAVGSWSELPDNVQKKIKTKLFEAYDLNNDDVFSIDFRTANNIDGYKDPYILYLHIMDADYESFYPSGVIFGDKNILKKLRE
jgi:hypothetical protein